MHIFIQVLARKLDGPRGTVISIENQVVTKRMHRRLVINETGYFSSAIVRSIVGAAGVHLISTVSKSSYLNIYGQLLIFCIPSFFFFVIPMILTFSSPEVRSSIPQCLKYFRGEIRWNCEKIPNWVHNIQWWLLWINVPMSKLYSSKCVVNVIKDSSKCVF